MSGKKIDLVALARKAMVENGLNPDFLPETEQEAKQSIPHAFAPHLQKDVRALPFCSIDNPDSRDLDQVQYMEQEPGGGYRLWVGIAHVAAWVPIGSLVDEHAMTNTTSVYTGVKTFTLIPESLCYDRSSLLPNKDSYALMVEMRITPDGHLENTTVYPALLRNQAKFHYEDVTNCLTGKPPESPLLREPLWIKQLQLQDQLAGLLRSCRLEKGALDLETLESRPVFEQGQVTTIATSEKNQARALIEDVMITTNQAVVRFLLSHKYPVVRRVVRTPSRWPRLVALAATLGERLPDAPNSLALAAFLAKQRQKDALRFPDLSLTVIKLLGKGEYIVESEDDTDTGHFGLAVQDYTHSTAPNRRYADLLTQRIVQACLLAQPVPYTPEALHQLAGRCTTKSDDAQKVERYMRKATAALWLRNRIGHTFDALVTGASAKGVYVRVLHPSVEGRVVKREQGLDVGDRCRVKLIFTDPEQGFIDFACVSG